MPLFRQVHSDVVGTGALRRLKADRILPHCASWRSGASRCPSRRRVLILHMPVRCCTMRQTCRNSVPRYSVFSKKGGIFLACREHLVKNEQERKIFLENHSLHKLTMTENAFRLEEYCEAIRRPGFPVRHIGPWESAINLFPGSVGDIKKGIASKLRLPVAPLIPDWLAYYAGRYARSAHYPGCLYTFICKKPS